MGRSCLLGNPTKNNNKRSGERKIRRYKRQYVLVMHIQCQIHGCEDYSLTYSRILELVFLLLTISLESCFDRVLFLGLFRDDFLFLIKSILLDFSIKKSATILPLQTTPRTSTSGLRFTKLYYHTFLFGKLPKQNKDSITLAPNDGQKMHFSCFQHEN